MRLLFATDSTLFAVVSDDPLIAPHSWLFATFICVNECKEYLHYLKAYLLSVGRPGKENNNSSQENEND